MLGPMPEPGVPASCLGIGAPAPSAFLETVQKLASGGAAERPSGPPLGGDMVVGDGAIRYGGAHLAAIARHPERWLRQTAEQARCHRQFVRLARREGESDRPATPARDQAGLGAVAAARAVEAAQAGLLRLTLTTGSNRRRRAAIWKVPRRRWGGGALFRVFKWAVYGLLTLMRLRVGKTGLSALVPARSFGR
jgi:hypothetical protein